MKNIFRKHKAPKWAKIRKPANTRALIFSKKMSARPSTQIKNLSALVPKPIYRFWGLAARLENKAIRIKGKKK